MISFAQIRAARGLLRWTQTMLAHKSGLSLVTLNMIETESIQPRVKNMAKIQEALEAGGVDFIEESGVGVGVKFRSKPPRLED